MKYALATALLLALAPLAARAGTVQDAVAKGHLTWSNADSSWVGEDLVLKFKTGEGLLHLPGVSRLRILAIGGGGAGGDSAENVNNGAGGGGGAGGFIELSEQMIDGGDYNIYVGQGGPKHAVVGTAGSKGTGNTGFGSAITNSETAVELIAVAGGGGGGFARTGQIGGSAGGGSASGKTTSRGGGVATPPGQGNNGGTGPAAKIAGGGGGAGGPGSDAVNSKPLVTGNGGLAKPSSITGTEVWYAGGGGAGIKDDTLPAGLGGGTSIATQKGGGGDGGTSSILPQDGVDGLGGGGGGAGTVVVGGKGGDGTVIVRISLVIDGPLDKPTNRDYAYDGTEKHGVAPIPGVLIITRENTATLVRDEPYVCHVELEEGFVWTDGTRDGVDVSWRILPGKFAPS